MWHRPAMSPWGFFFTFLKFKLLQVTQTVGVVVSITQKMSLILQQWYYYVYFY